MKRHLLFGTLAFLAGSLLAANAAPKDDVTAAAKALAGKDNYAWKQTTENAGGGGFGGGTSEGKIEKGGNLWLSMTMRDNTIEAVKKGDKGAIKTQDGGSRSARPPAVTRVRPRSSPAGCRPSRRLPLKSRTSSIRSRNSSRTVTPIPATSRKTGRSPSSCSGVAAAATGPRSAAPKAP